jgi:hypothetical protein
VLTDTQLSRLWSKIYEGTPLPPGTRDTEFIVATNGRVIGIAVEIQYE